MNAVRQRLVKLARDGWLSASPESDAVTGSSPAACQATPQSSCLVRLGAIAAMRAPQAVYQRFVADMTVAGLTEDEIICHLLEILPSIGQARAAAAARELALALEVEFEDPELEAS
jgi:hypothetical protein